jgi:hypothetical protein
LVSKGAEAIGKLSGAVPPAFPVETARFVQELARCVEADGPVPAMALKAKDP